MKKIVIATDSFKESISSKQINEIFIKEAKKYKKDLLIKPLLVSDGGEGIFDALTSFRSGKIISVSSYGPTLNKINAKYFFSDSKDAIIESADSIGYTKGKFLAGDKTSSCGLGLVIRDAIDKGAKRIVVGLGGTATCDLGVGMAYALGVKFFNKDNDEFMPTGEKLDQIDRIDDSILESLLKNVEIVALSDVNNPLLKEKGAVYTFGPQKNVRNLDKIEKNFEYLANKLDPKLIDNEGAGAAGGLGFAFMHFLKAKVYSGIDHVLDEINFTEKIKDASYIITGEGRIDSQSNDGKVISGILKKAKQFDIPVIGIFGRISEDTNTSDFYKVIEISSKDIPIDKAIKNTKTNYQNAVADLLKKIKQGEL